MTASLPTVDMPKVLIILRGIPGSGKSTFASILANDAGYKAFASDDLLYVDGKYVYSDERRKQGHEVCKQKVEESMVGGIPRIVLHNTSTSEWEFEHYLELAKKYDYKVFSLIVENRHGRVNTHNVPQEKVESMRENLINSIKL